MRSRLFLFVFCALLTQGACADFHRGSAPDAAPDGAVLVDDSVFENDVHPLLLNLCAICHSKGNPAENSRYLLTQNAKADRAMVLNLVTPSDPENSRLLRMGRGEDNHQGGQRLPPTGLEYPVIRDWIASLAKKP